MEQLQAILAEKRNELDFINHQKTIDQDAQNRRIKLINEISEIEFEISRSAEREQKFAEHIDGLLPQIQDLDPFGAMFPREQYNSVFGLTEYGEMQKQFNEFIYGVLSGQQTELFEEHKKELSVKDVEITALKETARAAEEREIQQRRQNEQLQEQLLRQEIVLQETEKRADAVEICLGDAEKNLLTALAERNQYKAKADALQAKLDAPEEVKPAPAVSQSLSERVAALKPVKTLKDMSADDLISRFNSRQAESDRVEMQVPALNLEPLGTEGEPGEPESFQAQETPVPFPGASGYPVHGEMEGTEPPKMDIETRLSEIEHRLTALENRAVVA